MTIIRFGFAKFPLDVTIPPEYADSYVVPTDLKHFWAALTPAMNEVIKRHPVRQGRDFVPHLRQTPVDYMPDDALASFRHYIGERDPSQNIFRYQLYDQRPESYAVWFLQQLFNYITGPGFAVG